MKEIHSILQTLGLLDSEISTYLAALEEGPSTVVDLSKITKLSRQATYTAIESLSQRGLMTSVLRGKKRFYAAEPPSKLLAYAKRQNQQMQERVKDLESMIPELELQTGGDRPVVRVYEEKEGLKAIIEDMKKNTSRETFEITDLDAMYKVLKPEDLKPLRQQLARRRIKIKGLYAGTAGPKMANSERYFLSNQNTGFKSHISIHGDKIEMVTFIDKIHSLTVESEHLSKTMKILFTLAIRGQKKK